MTPHTTSSKLWHLSLKILRQLIIIGVVVILGFTFYAVNMLPALHPWHTVRLKEEFSAQRHHNMDFTGYLQLEEKLFAELRATTATWQNQDDAWLTSRFNTEGVLNRLANGAPYNRSFRLAAAEPKGQALLIHGLSDSPYSMKALADSLHARGFDVTVLRLPGHGTLPSMMVEMDLRDWTAAVRLAARDVAARATNGQLFYIGGYSSGGTLSLQYTLDTLEDHSLRRPDRVLLLSPAIELTPIAAFSSIADFLSVIPIPVLKKARWQEVVAEYDPYKFNSFPINATRQINRATKALRESLERAYQAKHLDQMPPIVTWQSVIDATVGSTGVADQLYAKLNNPNHRLVLFDVNRHKALASVQRPKADAMIDQLIRSQHGYELEVVGNTSPDGLEVNVRRFVSHGEATTHDPGLSWPSNVVSLAHVALPFQPDDPVYGIMPDSGYQGIPSIGSWLLRGESGAVTISLGSLTRLRSNPFWQLIDSEVNALVTSDLNRFGSPSPQP